MAPQEVVARVPTLSAPGASTMREPACHLASPGVALQHLMKLQVFIAGSQTLAALVGNNKSLWPVFLEACRQDAELLQCDDPLDTYTEGAVQAAVAATGYAPAASILACNSHARLGCLRR